MAWETSNRKSRLPKNWEQIRQATRRRANDQCEWLTDGIRCQNRGTECDHIEAMKDDHTRTQWLCTGHHRQKTNKEAALARAEALAKRKAPQERHPGYKCEGQ